MEKKITIEEFKKIEKGFEDEHWWKFFFLDKKSIEAFKLIPKNDRYKAFKFLDDRSKEAFELIPPNDREKVFKYLNSRNKESFILIPSGYRKNAFKYLNEKNQETIKLVPGYENEPELLKLIGINPKPNESKENKKYKTREEFILTRENERYK